MRKAKDWVKFNYSMAANVNSVVIPRKRACVFALILILFGIPAIRHCNFVFVLNFWRKLTTIYFVSLFNSWCLSWWSASICLLLLLLLLPSHLLVEIGLGLLYFPEMLSLLYLKHFNMKIETILLGFCFEYFGNFEL